MVIYSSVCSELPAASNILACLRLYVYQFQVFSLYFASAARRCHYKECVGALIDSVEDPDPGFVRGGSIEGLSTWIRIYCAIAARQCHYRECVGVLIDSFVDPDPGFMRVGSYECLSNRKG